jgi:hypothetical protein
MIVSPTKILNPYLGFYTVNNIPFRSKNQAAVYAQATNQELNWNFNDEIFSANNWTIEPDESLDELYNRRARQLREDYDYIVITYSGGADSGNVLECFLRQNLHVDEILVNVNSDINKTIVLDPNEKSNWNYGAEYKLQIYPRLEEIRLRSPNTKITVLDTSENILETLRDGSDGEWVLNTVEPINISGATRYNYLYHKEIRKRFDAKTKIGIITGVDKPRCFIRKNQLWIGFVDKMVNMCPIAQHFDEYDNTVTEHFYWHPSCLKMLTKQCHILKRWLIANPQHQWLWRPKDEPQWYEHQRKQQELMRTVIYSTWNPNWFQAEKDKHWWYAEIDFWWHHQYSHTKEYKMWEAGVNYLSTYASKFVYQKDGRNDGLINFVRSYLIGDMPPIRLVQ